MTESPEPDESAQRDEAPAAAEDADAQLAVAPEEPRRYPSTIGGLFYLGVLLVTGAGIAIAATVDWRVGIRIIAGTMCAAAALRLALRESDAGMLAVRHRLLDAGMLASVGIVLFFLASSIPDQPT